MFTLLLQPKLNTTPVSWLELVDYLHMPTAVQMVPTIAVRHFMSPIRGKKQFVAFGQENVTDSISFPRTTISKSAMTSTKHCHLCWRHDVLDDLAVIWMIISRGWFHHVCWHSCPHAFISRSPASKVRKAYWVFHDNSYRGH